MTSSDETLQHLASLHGVHSDFFGLDGTHHPASPDTLRALLSALGVNASSERLIVDGIAEHAADHSARLLDPEYILQAGQTHEITLHADAEWSLQTEAGAEIAQGRADSTLTMSSLQIGYYQLHVSGAQTTQSARILVRPTRCPKPV